MKIKQITKKISPEYFFSKIESLCSKKGIKVFLVGGYVRDLFLDRKRSRLDFDFALEQSAIACAREFAKTVGGGFVVLDKDHGCARVVLGDHTFDFTDFRGKDLKQDLFHRDFTINAMALKLPLHKHALKHVIDYFRGKDDIKKKIIRAITPKSFPEDYLRILRAFSLSAQLSFGIEKKTLLDAKKYKKYLMTVAGERIREELFKIFDEDDSIRSIRALDTSGILSYVIPQIEIMRSLKQGPYHHLDVWGHSLETLHQCERLFKEVSSNEELRAYLDDSVCAYRRRRQLIKLVCLLHDIGKPRAYEVKEGKTRFHGHERIGRDIADAVSEQFKLSTREKFAIDTMIFWHLRPGYLADNKTVSERAKFRYFRDTGSEAASILLLSISDQRATRGPLARPTSRLKHEKVAFGLIDEFFERKKQKKFVRLISGDDLIKELKLKPAPFFKTILQEVEETQAEGTITTKKQALALARTIAKRGK